MFCADNDYKSKLNDIMNKYKHTQKNNFSTEINTREFKTILNTIDNIMKTSENINESNIGDFNNILSKIGKTEIFSIKKKKVQNLLTKEILLDEFTGYNSYFKSSNNNLFKKGKILLSQNRTGWSIKLSSTRKKQ